MFLFFFFLFFSPPHTYSFPPFSLSSLFFLLFFSTTSSTPKHTRNSLSLSHTHTNRRWMIETRKSQTFKSMFTHACPLLVLLPTTAQMGQICFFCFLVLIWLVLTLWFEFVFWLRLSLEMFESEKIWNGFVVSRCESWVKIKYFNQCLNF